MLLSLFLLISRTFCQGFQGFYLSGGLSSRYKKWNIGVPSFSPDEYIALTSNAREPYYINIDIPLPDNWLHQRFYNIPMDSLLAKTERAVRTVVSIICPSANSANRPSP